MMGSRGFPERLIITVEIDSSTLDFNLRKQRLAPSDIPMLELDKFGKQKKKSPAKKVY